MKIIPAADKVLYFTSGIWLSSHDENGEEITKRNIKETTIAIIKHSDQISRRLTEFIYIFIIFYKNV